jgi:hypothetical protein
VSYEDWYPLTKSQLFGEEFSDFLKDMLQDAKETKDKLLVERLTTTIESINKKDIWNDPENWGGSMKLNSKFYSQSVHHSQSLNKIEIYHSEYNYTDLSAVFKLHQTKYLLGFKNKHYFIFQNIAAKDSPLQKWLNSLVIDQRYITSVMKVCIDKIVEDILLSHQQEDITFHENNNGDITDNVNCINQIMKSSSNEKVTKVFV